MPDLTRPCCPIDNDINKIFCSVSHDSRFVIVVVSQNNIGIDVEEISNKIINLKRYFINDFDNLDSNLSQKEVFTKIWTIKEAVSKAFDINLAKSWQKVFVKKIGLKKSIFEFDKKDYFAIHEILDNHIF